MKVLFAWECQAAARGTARRFLAVTQMEPTYSTYDSDHPDEALQVWEVRQAMKEVQQRRYHAQTCLVLFFLLHWRQVRLV
jgi:hypothetical protein